MSNEEDQRFDTSKILRYGAGGLLAGGGVAAALSLAHLIRSIKKDNEPDQTDKDTIVLTLPKRAEHTPEHGIITTTMRTDSKGIPTVSTKSKEMPSTSRGQLRQPKGTYGIKINKQASWPTLTASLLAAGVGGVAGYTLVDRIYEKHRINKQKEKLEAVKQEYLDMLQKASTDSGEKKAGDDFNVWDYPAGLGALALILGAGGTAYITKKILDEKNREEDTQDKEMKKVKNIVFRTAGASPMSKVSQAENDESVGIVKAALGVMLDVCSGEHCILADAKVASALTKTGCDAGDLYKMAGEDYQNLLTYMKNNPDVRNLVTRASMDNHPILKYFKWTSGIPGISHIADAKLYNKAEQLFGPKQAEKVAGLMDMLGAISASTIGSNIAESDSKVSIEGKKDKKKKVVDEPVNIGATDREAAEFVANNQEAIKKVIDQLRAQGKI